MPSHLTEFFTIAIAHWLAVASPGPDFAVVVKHSLISGRKVGLWVSVGVGLGILVHVSYCLLGIGLILAQSIVLFTMAKIAGATYLIYLGLKALRSGASSTNSIVNKSTSGEAISIRQAVSLGFLTNALNPKATLFFLALFSLVISPTTSVGIQTLYGLWMSIATILWFSFVAVVLSHGAIRLRFLRYTQLLDRLMGIVFIALGLQLAFARVTR